MNFNMEQHINERAEMGKAVIDFLKKESERFASPYSDESYYSFLAGQLEAVIQGMCLDLDDKGVERLKRIYLKGEEE